MTSFVVAMVLILILAVAVVGVVVVGIEGRGKNRAPKLADTMARAAHHLNGEAEPPRLLTRPRR